MNQQAVNKALADVQVEDQLYRSWRGSAIPREQVLRVVYDFLSRLIYGGANFWERQVLRTVRGYVAGAMRSHGLEVPDDTEYAD